MEIEPSTPVVMKKLWNVVRAILFMLRKGLYKSKIMFDLHLMLKRGKIAGKIIGNLVEFHHRSAFSCQTVDIANSYISTRDYEFSCSNSPAYPFQYFNKLRGKHHNHRFYRKSHRCDDFSTVKTFQRVSDILYGDQKSEASPLVTLPGFGKSPKVRQLRVTDSPFSLREDDVDSQFVDKAAEDFINKFYRDLRLEKSLAALDSQYRNTLSR